MSINPSDLRRAARGNRALSIAIGVLLAGGLALLLLWNAILVRIPPGRVGVLYSLFSGTVTDDLYPEGLAIKLPWNRMYIFDARWQALPFEVQAFSQEGMPVTVRATIIFRLRRPQIPNVLVELGTDYAQEFVKPIATSAVRLLVTRYDSHELYTVGYKDLYERLMEMLQNSAEARFFDYHDVIVRQIELPKDIVDAIQRKLNEEQIAASYQFRLIAQRQEAERLRIQAIGLRNFYSILQDSLTDKLLTWRGIEATVEIAKSPNSKIVIVGGQKDQMPLILGSEFGRLPASSEPVPPVSGTSSPLPDFNTLPPIFPSPGGAPQPSDGAAAGAPQHSPK
ncbi:MAG TPA: prohibitin family protein [Reyranella sp.]|nr:prohibitin family protein [Reyranella sp.]